MGSIVVIAASAGGFEPLRTIMAKLPVPCAASIFVVWHIGQRQSVLPSILSKAGRLPARFAQDNALIEPGHIYVAPPDHHLVLTADHMHLNRDPRSITPGLLPIPYLPRQQRPTRGRYWV